MKDNFTEQQREIVARKMGFDGPMQNFGEFLMSSPSAATQYASVVGKLSEKAQGFAVGGAVKKTSATEIVKAYAASKGQNATKALAVMTVMLKSSNAILLQQDNTILFIDKHMPRIVALHMATIESGAKLDGSLEVLIDKVKKSGITMAYGSKQNEELKQAFIARRFQVLNSDVPEYAWRVIIK